TLVGAAWWVGPLGIASAGGRQGLRRLRRRLRLLLLSHCAGNARPRDRAVLLPAEDGIAPGGATLERRVRAGAGEAGHSARQRAGDRPGRDAARCVRDGRG